MPLNLPLVDAYWRVGSLFGDTTIDADREPDIVWANSGDALLEPVIGNIVYTDENGRLATLTNAPKRGVIKPGGRIAWEDDTTAADNNIRVVDLTDESLEVRVHGAEEKTHTLIVRNVKVNGQAVFGGRTSFDVRIAADMVDEHGVVNLASQIPREAAAPIVVDLREGPQGVSVVGPVQPAPGQLALELSDGTTTDPIDLPAGTLPDDPSLAAALGGTETQAALNAQTVDGLQDPGAIRDAADARVIEVLRSISTLNILDPQFGVSIGVAASQTAAIKAAFDANPGRTFYFPPGTYRLDTELAITQRNNVVADKNAVFIGYAAMDTLISYSDADNVGYAEDRCWIGGTLDGMGPLGLMANKLMTIAGVLRFTLTQATFKDGINRGLVTVGNTGAELFAYDLRFVNTTTANVADNIAIEANMGDSHFQDIVMRDWTVGVKDTGVNIWSRVHPWIGPDGGTGKNHMTDRYPTSIAFDLTGKSEIGHMCISDTMRIAFKSRTNGTAYTAPPRIIGARATWHDGTLPDALATANPAYVLDNTDGVGFVVKDLSMKGKSAVPASLLTGPSANLLVRDAFTYGYVKGAQGGTADPLDYDGPAPLFGVQQGERTFTPTLYGTTDANGGHGTGYTHTYTTQTGRMQVVGNRVDYFINVVATVSSSTNFAGSLRVGGLPMPTGATSIRDGVGVAGGTGAGVVSTWCVIFAGPSAIVAPRALNSGSGDDVLVPALRGTTVRFMAHVTTTLLKSS